LARRLMTSLLPATILFATKCSRSGRQETLIEKRSTTLNPPAYGTVSTQRRKFLVAHRLPGLSVVAGPLRPAWRFISTALDSQAVGANQSPKLDESASVLREEAQAHTGPRIHSASNVDTLRRGGGPFAEPAQERADARKTHSGAETEATLERAREQQALDMIARAEIPARSPKSGTWPADLAIDCDRGVYWTRSLSKGQKGRRKLIQRGRISKSPFQAQLALTGKRIQKAPLSGRFFFKSAVPPRKKVERLLRSPRRPPTLGQSSAGSGAGPRRCPHPRRRRGVMVRAVAKASLITALRPLPRVRRHDGLQNPSDCAWIRFRSARSSIAPMPPPAGNTMVIG